MRTPEIELAKSYFLRYGKDEAIKKIDSLIDGAWYKRDVNYYNRVKEIIQSR